MLLTLIHHLLIPEAHAVTLESAGATNPGVALMWMQICNILPFCGVGLDAPRMFACKIARFIFGSISGLGVCVVIYAALRMTIAQGDDSAIDEAKKMIYYAAGGIVLSMIAFAMVPFISIVISAAFGEAFSPTVPLSCG